MFSRLSPEILDPCLPQGMVLEGRENPYYKFKGLGDYHKCQEALIPLLNASVPCPVQPCTFNGVYQPEINFYNSEFYGFSEFWYTMEDVYRIGGQYEADIFDAQAKVSTMVNVLKFRTVFYCGSQIKRYLRFYPGIENLILPMLSYPGPQVTSSCGIASKCIQGFLEAYFKINKSMQTVVSKKKNLLL